MFIELFFPTDAFLNWLLSRLFAAQLCFCDRSSELHLQRKHKQKQSCFVKVMRPAADPSPEHPPLSLVLATLRHAAFHSSSPSFTPPVLPGCISVELSVVEGFKQAPAPVQVPPQSSSIHPSIQSGRLVRFGASSLQSDGKSTAWLTGCQVTCIAGCMLMRLWGWMSSDSPVLKPKQLQPREECHNVPHLSSSLFLGLFLE